MKRNITAMEARKNFGDLLNRVSLKDERYVINRAGKPIAAVISISELEKMEQSEEEARTAFYSTLDAVRKKVKSSRPKEIENAITEAVSRTKKKSA